MNENLNINKQGVSEGNEKFKIKVLLAEDNPGIQLVTVEVLESFGCSVEAVNNGKKFLDRLAATQSGEFGLFIIDKDMPVMGGMEVLEKINLDSNLNKLPRILYSGALDPEIEKRVKELGGSCLAKPATLEQMSKAIKEALFKSTQ